MTYKLADGKELPEGERRVHRHSFNKTSLGNIEVTVIETRFPNVVMLTASGNQAARQHFPHLAPEYLTTIVSYYMAIGWTLLSMSGDAAAMQRR